ncbi:hypothetical protein FKR81_25760 [Lentzea tibetensis]|uniref:Uncharacterized protein n=1 Tax=Lentzea tibetensis TaxID=2591470 RepID=A0A563EP57_9PSEU|nr:hypothetical protein [Lentzea tibetensis]TWP49081.1 hypothetical protein FKR81_25760 [Lentzea tibetensis]
MLHTRRSAAIALATTLLVTTQVQAKPLEHVQFHNAGSDVIEDFCGDLEVRFTFDDRGTFLFNQQGRDRLAHSHVNLHGTASWTNLANGRTLTHVYHVTEKELKVTDNGDGTLTLLVQASGSTKFIGPDGQVLNDPGQFRFELLFDHNGTPADPSDDEFVADLGVVKPSTGRNDLEGHDLCTDVHELIG